MSKNLNATCCIVLVSSVILSILLQIEDMSQQAQMAAAEKFKEPTVNPAADTAAHTTVSCYLVENFGKKKGWVLVVY